MSDDMLRPRINLYSASLVISAIPKLLTTKEELTKHELQALEELRFLLLKLIMNAETKAKLEAMRSGSSEQT